MSHISADDVRKVAKLARLDLPWLQDDKAPSANKINKKYFFHD